MARTLANIVVGIGGLAALALTAALLASSFVAPTPSGYEWPRLLGVLLLVVTLGLIILAWARFVVASRR